MPEHFLTFCENLDECIKLPVKFKGMGYAGKEYPIGTIDFAGGIDIHFLHYNTFSEAQKKWYDRCKRVNKNRIVILFSDQNGCEAEHIKRFNRLDYPKLLFVGKNENAKMFENSIYITPTKQEIEENINPVDKCMFFGGLTGKRRYEKHFNVEKFFKDLESNKKSEQKREHYGN